MTIVNEPGLYSLILRSHKLQAKNVTTTDFFKTVPLRKSREKAEKVNSQKTKFVNSKINSS